MAASPVPSAPTLPRWTLLLSPPLSGAENMALDEALMGHSRRTGEWVLRVYSWREPTLSFGRNQRANGAYDRERLALRAIAVVRRPTGGRALLHHREITYAVTAPSRDAGDLRESYARINRLLVSALRTFGVDARIVDGTTRTPAPGPSPCFAEPSAGELVVDDRKLVGSAQWRHDGALLQHGSILVEDDQTMIAALANETLPPSPPPATLAGALGYAPAVDTVARALFDAARAQADSTRMLELDDATVGDAAALRAKYLDDAWTWRR